jgi:sec-independent protein translocase protein TatA
MGFGGISIWQLLIVLVIVLLLFGTKRLRNLGADLGNAIKGFRGAMSGGEQEKDKEQLEQKPEERVIEGETTAKDGDPVGKDRDKGRA